MVAGLDCKGALEAGGAGGGVGVAGRGELGEEMTGEEVGEGGFDFLFFDDIRARKPLAPVGGLLKPTGPRPPNADSRV